MRKEIISSLCRKNPAIYSELSPQHQELVRAGQIEEGMSKPAVFLAMGQADRELVKVEKNKRLERWSYNPLQPVYHSSFNSGFGHNGFRRRSFGRRGFRGRGFGGHGYSSSLTYVPRVGSIVYFEEEKVTGWEGYRR